MTTLGLTFLAGRYHATAWDRHVNEGVCEWPPAPLRVLRALAAALFERCPEVEEQAALAVLGKLTAPPRYRVPALVTQGHTRHYLSRNQTDRNATAMAFDSFVCLRAAGEPTDRDAPDVEISWDVALDAGERALLARLAGAVPYLGRAESWCRLRLLDEGTQAAHNCAPTGDDAADGVRLLCAAPGCTAEELLQPTALSREEGHGQPPGTRWVRYRLPAPLRATTEGRREPAEAPQVAEFALGGPVLPRLIDGVRVAVQVRRALLWLHQVPSAVLSGHDADGARLQGHQHAHFVPEGRDGRGVVTHVVVYAPGGFGASEVEALSRLRYLSWQGYEDSKRAARRGAPLRGLPADQVPSLEARRQDGGGSLDVVLTGLWTAEAYALRGDSRLFGKAKEWRSRTPFVLPRHQHRQRARDLPEGQLRAELARRLGVVPEIVELTRIERNLDNVAWRDFRRHRPQQNIATGYAGFSVRFQEEVAGPLLLGANCHFGLGQFVRS